MLVPTASNTSKIKQSTQIQRHFFGRKIIAINFVFNGRAINDSIFVRLR